MTRASVLLGAGSLAMPTGLMGAAAPAIELAVEGGAYVTSEVLSVYELRRRLATAAVAGVTPLHLYACSLEQPADRAQALRVRIENQGNRPLEGIVSVALLAGGRECGAPFAAPAGGLVDVDQTSVTPARRRAS